MSNKETNEQKPMPAYFAIIPASVRYAQNLAPNTKLLYGEITALCNEKGYCWATNDYFANLYRVKKATISEWISQLVATGLLTREIIYKEDSKEIAKRILRLTESLPLSDKNRIPPMEKSDDPIPKKPKENNTMNSVLDTDVSNKGKNKKFIIPSIEEIKKYCIERNNGIDAQNFHDFYSSKGWYVGKNKMKDWKAAIRTWEKPKKNNSFPKGHRNSEGFTSGSQLYGGL